MLNSKSLIDKPEAALETARALQIQRDIATVEELARHGFQGPSYEVFRNRLCEENWKPLQGMLRNRTLAQLTAKYYGEAGIDFFVRPADADLLHSSADARHEILVDILIKALKVFRRRALVEGGWNPHHRGPKGASTLNSFFIGQCAWQFRDVYLSWSRKRERLAAEEAALLDGGSLLPLLRTHVEGPEAFRFDGALMELVAQQPELTRAILRLTTQGYADGEIADMLQTTPGAVRNRRYRFRTALYNAARAGRIWIPAQLHTAGNTAETVPGGAA
ncbi:RNA polymerase sigma factor [Streptomyces sp. NPDC000961]|uniref:RNA polymerase sigma factor n=1 Tax=Streptomyces sp. NPDC000961 TaxID=3364541 RepID=UPI0036AFB6A6